MTLLHHIREEKFNRREEWSGRERKEWKERVDWEERVGKIEEEWIKEEERFHGKREVDKEARARGSRRIDRGAGIGSWGERHGARRRVGKLRGRQQFCVGIKGWGGKIIVGRLGSRMRKVTEQKIQTLEDEEEDRRVGRIWVFRRVHESGQKSRTLVTKQKQACSEFGRI